MTEREHSEEYRQLEETITALEAQRDTLGDTIIETALGPIAQQLADLLDPGLKLNSEYEGERKLVTIMFADLSGFTSLSDERDSEPEREMVNACFNHIAPIIEKYEGTIEKFIGD